MIGFDMTDLGKMCYFLGIEVIQSPTAIFIGQEKYAQEVLNKFQMVYCNSVQNPIVLGVKLARDAEGEKIDSTHYKQLIDSLMYMSATRANMMYAIKIISMLMEAPKEFHLTAANKVLRYMRGIADYGLFYKKSESDQLVCFSDSDYAGDLEDRKSTLGYIFMLNSSAISWSLKKQ